MTEQEREAIRSLTTAFEKAAESIRKVHETLGKMAEAQIASGKPLGR